jgi:ABC-type transport system substrate-binding protein
VGSKAPTSNREIDVQDVLFSWDRFSRLGQQRGILSYNAETAPDAPIDSISAPDRNTIVFKLRKENAAILPLLAQGIGFFIMPREADGGFNPRGEIRGYGPYLLEEHLPSARFVWRKNPDYHVKDRPFIDRIEKPIIPEYASRLSQFRAGNIYTSVVTPEDVIQTKKDLPDLLLRQATSWQTGLQAYLRYGYEGNSPFKDQRVRQALAMLIDRPSYVDAVTNRDRFVAEGMPLEVRFQNMVPTGYEEAWLDPTDEKKFGSEAKYYKFDVAEAKKLLTARAIRMASQPPTGTPRTATRLTTRRSASSCRTCSPRAGSS